MEILKCKKMNIIYRSVAVFTVILLFDFSVYARKILDSSDSYRPHWCERADDIMRYNPTYEYKCIVSVGPDLTSLKKNRILRLKEHFQSEYSIKGESETDFTHFNENGEVYDTDSYKITFKTTTSVEKFQCIYIDEYWEQYEDGEYQLYTLYAVSIPNVVPNFDTYTLSTYYKPLEGVTRSLVPGWGQLYKGNKIKGGLIIAGEVLGIGGIVACYSMKSSYEKFMYENPRHMKEYSEKADMWTNIGYGCIAFTVAVYVFNLIDAAVAPGSRRVIVLPQQSTLSLLPIVSCDGNVGIAMKYNF